MGRMEKEYNRLHCEKHLKMLSVKIMYEQFKQSPKWMNYFWYGFADLFKENMERKSNHD